MARFHESGPKLTLAVIIELANKFIIHKFIHKLHSSFLDHLFEFVQWSDRNYITKSMSFQLTLLQRLHLGVCSIRGI